MSRFSRIKKYAEFMLIVLLWTTLIMRSMEFLSDSLALMKFSPYLDKIDIGALVLFFNVYNFHLITIILCAGFLVIYYALKNKEKEKN